jgi:FAD/FMN-containing dehydrogenase
MQLIPDFQGDQFRPGDAGFDDARRVFNAMIDRRPALIACCVTTEDVMAALAHARRQDAPLAVRAGGHSVAGMSLIDDGLVIDVRRLTEITVDPAARVARAGAGMTWAEFDAATQAHGLAATGGRVSSTGIAGLTLGGGSGWLERSCGLACDALLAVELVTAAGELIRASADEHPDLFWALHGGGGNFGVVTALEYRLQPVGPMLYGGLAAYDPADGRRVARAFRDFHHDAPDAAGLAFGYVTAPPEEFVPPAWRGRRISAIVGCWNGSIEDGERAVAPLLAVADPIVNLFGEIPYTQLQSMIDDPPGYRNWWTAEYLDELPDAAVDAFCDASELMPTGLSQSLLVPWGGAVARVGEGDTPMAKRDAPWVVHPFCVWEDAARDVEHMAWGRATRAAFAPWSSGGVYLNFIGDEGEERIRAAFGPSYERLAEVKRTYDPGNLFAGNQNVRPSRAGTAAD